MTTDLLPYLGSLQLADAAFPSGLYTLSHGLEAYVQAGQVRSERELEELIADLLRHGVGPSDGVALANAHRAVADGDPALAAEADVRLTATKLAREGRAASVRTGRQVITLARALLDHPVLAQHADRVACGELPGNHAVAIGLAMAAQGVPREHALGGELHAFVVSCTGAAIRLSVADHRSAQRTLLRLRPVIAEAVEDNVGKGVHEIASGTPMADVMATYHERADARLFIS